MAGYSKMDIMSMSEEEIKSVLKEEGKDLPDHTVFFMTEELKRRAQFEEAVKAVASEEDSEEDFDEDLEETEETEEIVDEEDASEPLMTPEEQEEEEKRERAEENQKLIEEYKKSRKRTLTFALIGAGVAALAVVGFIIYLYVSGMI